MKTSVKPKRNATTSARPRQQSRLGLPVSLGDTQFRSSSPQRRKQQVNIDKSSSDSSSESAVEEGFADGDDLVRTPLPKKHTRNRRKSDSSATSGSSQARLPPHPRPIVVDDDSEAKDSDEQPLVPASSGRNKTPKRPIAIDDSDEEDIVQPIKRRRLVRRGSTAASESSNAPTSQDPKEPLPSGAKRHEDVYTLMKRGGRRAAAQAIRTPKQKQMELLRRRRAGEVVEEDDLSSSEEEEHKAAYDTDSDHLALSEFDDDDDDEAEAEPELPATGIRPLMAKKSKKTKSRTSESQETTTSRSGSRRQSEDDDNLDGFVVEDDDGPLGVPQELLDIPIEFTSRAHRPMKDHFRDAIEWLVKLKIKPDFSDRKAGVYRMAWRKLDDEVQGLAQSKFASSVWRPDFYLALRARPGITAIPLPGGHAHESETCMACGRSNHPARSVISFHGSAYHKGINHDKFLDPVESDTESDSEGAGANDHESEDEDGHHIPKEDKEWFVGSVCSSNAQTAHMLIHWKRELLTWVVTNLELDNHMRPEDIKKRETMRPKQLDNLVDQIMASWTSGGTLKQLYRSFKKNLDEARNKSTSGKGSRGWR